MFSFFKRHKKEEKKATPEYVKDEDIRFISSVLKEDDFCQEDVESVVLDLISTADLTYHTEGGETSTSILFYGLMYGTPKIVEAMLKKIPDIKNVSHIGSCWEETFTLTNIVPNMKPENLAAYLKYIPATHTSPKGRSLLMECANHSVCLGYNIKNAFKNICLLLEHGANPADLKKLPNQLDLQRILSKTLEKPLSEKETSHIISLIPYVDLLHHTEGGETSTSVLYYGLMYGTPEIADAMLKQLPDITKKVHHIGAGWEEDFTLTNIVPKLKPENLAVYLKYIPATHTSPEGKTLLQECVQASTLPNHPYIFKNICLLLENGANPGYLKDIDLKEYLSDFERQCGNTLLHIAAKINSLPLAQALLQNNMIPVPNKEGRYPKDYAQNSMMYHILSVAQRKHEERTSIKPTVTAQQRINMQQHTGREARSE